jgi:2'-5' RNA ligase
MTSTGTVVGDERLRLFLALRLQPSAVEALHAWAAAELHGGGRVVPPEHLHVTLAFLGSRPAGELPAIVDALRECAASAGPIELEPVRWRETRSVGMVVLDDHGGGATRMATAVHERLESLGVYEREARPWLPHVTVLRFRERPRLRPELPPLGRLAPSDAAAFLSRLHPSGARYEVLESTALGGVTTG